MPWVPESSVASKSRFHGVRQEQRPRSYSPPPTPPAARDVPPLDVLPFPAIVPSSTEGPTLRRAASFHPGGSQRLRREALVMDGKVTIDTGFKFRSRSLESIASNPSQRNDDMDLVVRQLSSGHQSGLERLKNSMLELMKAQPRWQHSRMAKGEHSESVSATAHPKKPEDRLTEGTSRNVLAIRRGQPIPSALGLAPASCPHFIPQHLGFSAPFRESPSAVTTLSEEIGPLPASESDKRESINVEDMCTNLRYLVSPIILTSASMGDISPSRSRCPTADPVRVLGIAAMGTSQTPVRDWSFASELERVYGDDPFTHFDIQERMPSFIRPLSTTPDVAIENTETQQSSGSSATSVSAFPVPPTETPSIPYVTVSGDTLVPVHPSTRTRSSPLSSAAASDEQSLDSEDGDEAPAHVAVGSTETSPRSSEDKDEPLAVRRLTLLARSSVAVFKMEDPSPPGSFPSLDREKLKPAPKVVRFVSETEQPIHPGNPQVALLSHSSQRPRSLSVPPPQKGSLRNKTSPKQDERRHERLSRSQPVTLSSRIPKKTPITARIEVPSQCSVTTDTLTPGGLRNRSKGGKRLSSLIPSPKASNVPVSPDHEKTAGEKRVAGRNSRFFVSLKHPAWPPTPQPAKPQLRAPLATSWSMTLRQYVKGGEQGREKSQMSNPQPLGRHREPNLSQGSSIGTKSLLPVKKGSFFRDGTVKVTPPGGARDRIEGQGQAIWRGDGIEGCIIGSVDKTGGISYIAPPKIREARSQARVKGERQGTSTRTLKPVQIRNLLGRFTA